MSAEDYETLCMHQDDERNRQLSEGRCKWCDWCELPPWGDLGWCSKFGYFAELRASPAMVDCDEYKTDGINERSEP